MKQVYSKSWKASKSPAKQRKYVFNAPLHLRGKFISSMLSKDLKTKYSKNSLRVRKGDKVKVLRGQFKGKEGKIESVDLQRGRVYMEKVETVKKDGTKTQYPLHPSNLMITELELSDKKRINMPKAAKSAQQKKDAEKESAKPKESIAEKEAKDIETKEEETSANK